MVTTEYRKDANLEQAPFLQVPFSSLIEQGRLSNVEIGDVVIVVGAEKQHGSMSEDSDEYFAEPGKTTDSDERSSETSSETETNKLQDISMFDPKVRGTVLGTTKTIAMACALLVCVFPLMLSLFYGVGWSPKDNYRNVQLLVADLDGGIIGLAIRAAAAASSVPFTVTFATDGSLSDVKGRVDSGAFSAALIAMPGASSALAAALHDPSAPFPSSAAAAFVFDEGRGGPTMAALLRTVVPPIAAAAANAAVGKQLFLQLANGSSVVSAVNPAALISPVGCSEINLHPVPFAGEVSSAGLGARPVPTLTSPPFPAAVQPFRPTSKPLAASRMTRCLRGLQPCLPRANRIACPACTHAPPPPPPSRSDV